MSEPNHYGCDAEIERLEAVIHRLLAVNAKLVEACENVVARNIHPERQVKFNNGFRDGKEILCCEARGESAELYCRAALAAAKEADGG